MLKNSKFLFSLGLWMIVCSCQQDPKKNQNNALNAFLKGDYESSMNFINEAISSDSTDFKSYLIKGEILFKQKKYQDASIAFEICTRKDSNIILAWYEKGLANYFLNKYEIASEDFSTAIRLKGNDTIYLEFNSPLFKHVIPDVAMSEIKYYRALSFYYNNQYKLAIKDFSFCEMERFRIDETYLFLGNIYLAYNEKEIGCEYLNKSISLGNIEATEFHNQFCK